MTLFNIKYIKTIAAVGAMVFFVGCSNDTVTATGGIVDNESFKRDTLTVVPQLSTELIDLGKVRTSSLSSYLFGEFTDANFGSLKSDFVGQLIPNEFPDSIKPGVTVKSVELLLPLNLTAKDIETFEVANFMGDYTSTLSLEVSAINNYMELFNIDGSRRVYFSNGANNRSNDGSSISDLDIGTILGSIENYTVKEEYTESADTIKISLDKDYFQVNVLEKMEGVKETSGYTIGGEIFDNLDFVSLFKGLTINNTTTGTGFVAPFDISKAKVEIVYNNVGVEEDNTFTLDFGRVNHNLYTRDHVNAGVANELYVQGAGGYEISIDLENLINTNKPIAADEDWLINQATLTIFTKEVVEDTLDELYVYGIDNDGDAVAINDYGFFNVINPVGGIVKDVNGENTQGYVQFFLTNYVRAALLSDSNIKELRIKARELNESTVVNTSSINPKGIVFLNDVSSVDKAPKLEIVYSAIK